MYFRTEILVDLGASADGGVDEDPSEWGEGESDPFGLTWVDHASDSDFTIEFQ